MRQTRRHTLRLFRLTTAWTNLKSQQSLSTPAKLVLTPSQLLAAKATRHGRQALRQQLRSQAQQRRPRPWMPTSKLPMTYATIPAFGICGHASRVPIRTDLAKRRVVLHSCDPDTAGSCGTSCAVQKGAIRAKAMRDINACRKICGPAAPDPLRGFAGQTFVTPAGRKLTAEEYLRCIERFSRVVGFDELPRNADGTVKLPEPSKDPYQKILSAEAFEAMQARLSTPALAPPRPPPRPAVWVQLQLVEGRWVEVEKPWRKLGAAKKTEKMRSMYDRCEPWRLCHAACARQISAHWPRLASKRLWVSLLHDHGMAHWHTKMAQAADPIICRYKEDQAAKLDALNAKYLKPLDKNPKAAQLTAEEALRKYHLKVLKYQLSPQFHGAAAACVTTPFACAASRHSLDYLHGLLRCSHGVLRAGACPATPGRQRQWTHASKLLCQVSCLLCRILQGEAAKE
jgi:hypothetical protein